MYLHPDTLQIEGSGPAVEHMLQYGAQLVLGPTLSEPPAQATFNATAPGAGVLMYPLPHHCFSLKYIHVIVPLPVVYHPPKEEKTTSNLKSHVTQAHRKHLTAAPECPHQGSGALGLVRVRFRATVVPECPHRGSGAPPAFVSVASHLIESSPTDQPKHIKVKHKRGVNTLISYS